jgi:ATP-dependent Clp protease, protease subunit
MRQWFTMKAEDKSAEIVIYDEIGKSFWDEDTVTAKQFVADLNAMAEVDTILLRINSPGGDVFDGVAIHNALKNHKATITAQVDGIAASAASFIAMAADKIVMPSNSFMLVHGASGFAMGGADDIRSLADDLDRIDKSLTATYAARAKTTQAKVKALMKEDRLMDADEAKSLGFADEVTAPIKMSAKFSLRLLPKAAAARLQAVAGDNETDPAEPAPPQAPTVPPALEATPNPPADPDIDPPAEPTAQLISLNAKQSGVAEHKAYVEQITDLCALARVPERVGAYVRAETTVEQVRKELLAMRAEEPPIIGQHPLIEPQKAPANAWSRITDKLNAKFQKKGA